MNNVETPPTQHAPRHSASVGATITATSSDGSVPVIRPRSLTKYPKFLVFLELVAAAFCCYGLWVIWSHRDVHTTASLLAGSIWFVLGGMSNFCGVVGLCRMLYEDVITRESQLWIQKHYILAWLTIVIGYPCFVILAWMSHYPTSYVYVHTILALLPILCYALRKVLILVQVTQVASALTILSHVYISFLAGQKYGFLGAALMILNVASLSIPTKYSIFGVSSREMYVLGLSATSLIFSIEVGTTARHPFKVTSLKLWR